MMLLDGTWTELVMVGMWTEGDKTFSHSCVFLRVLGKSGKPVIVYLNCGEEEPFSTNPRDLLAPTSLLKWERFAGLFSVMRLYKLKSRRCGSSADEQEALVSPFSFS